MRRLAFSLSTLLLLSSGCRSREGQKQLPDLTPAVTAPRVSASAAPSSAAVIAARPEYLWYRWLQQYQQLLGSPGDLLRDRLLSPTDFLYDAVEIDSAGEWLRYLPVFPPNTSVKDGTGLIVLPGNDKTVAAVIQMDVGKQCALSSLGVAYRLHAEWLWHRGERRISYRTASDDELPLALWARGQRPQVRGNRVYFTQEAPPKRQLAYLDVREYIDGILPFLDLGAVMKHSRALSPGEVRAGDLFVHAQAPGEAVIILDTATNRSDGRRAFLLGRVLDPCSSLFVIGANVANPWVIADAKSPIVVPGMKPFEWKDARRLKSYGVNPDR